MNTFGRIFRVTSFGESHGPAMGVVVDGCPAGVLFDEELLLKNLARRRPGQSHTVSSRKEEDRPQILSGIYQGKTLGTPIAVLIPNQDARSQDYEGLAPRNGHADDVWLKKFGHVDPRGGGRASGRETVSRVIAGSLAQMALHQLLPELKVVAFSRRIGPVELPIEEESAIREILSQPGLLDSLPGRIPHAEKSQVVEALLVKAREDGESYGGVAEVWVEHPPLGLGQPVFHKLKAELASAILSVGAVSSFSLGRTPGDLKGSEFHKDFESENYGGIRGGISTGEKIILQAGFKPTSSIMDVAKKGRHDPCIVPRAIPVLEAMVNLVLIDHVLWSRLDRI